LVATSLLISPTDPFPSLSSSSPSQAPTSPINKHRGSVGLGGAAHTLGCDIDPWWATETLSDGAPPAHIGSWQQHRYGST
jgi:hypothetical protein